MKKFVNKKNALSEVLFDLADKMDEFVQRSMSMKKYWYWEYYKSIEQDIEDRELRRRIYQQIYHLERFKYFEKNGFSFKAIEKLRKLREQDEVVEVRWDKKWRIVIFDIPENKRKVRDLFRNSLKQMGFKLLQGSIWVNPFVDLKEVQDIIKEYRIEKYVVFIAADKISNDLLFKQKFDLL